MLKMALTLLTLFGLLMTEQVHGNIFGQGHRKPVDLQDPRFTPVVSIGSLAGRCTGAMIGANIVLTAFHCIRMDENLKPAIRVYIQYAGGNYADSANTLRVISEVKLEKNRREYSIETQQDWAMLVIDKNWGNTYGYYRLADHRSRPEAMTVFGYPWDFWGNPTESYDCRIRDTDGKMLLSDCDVLQGNSGGPLLSCDGKTYKNCRIVGVIESQGGVPGLDLSSVTYKAIYSQYVSSGATFAVDITEIIPHFLAATGQGPKPSEQKSFISKLFSQNP